MDRAVGEGRAGRALSNGQLSDRAADEGEDRVQEVREQIEQHGIHLLFSEWAGGSESPHVEGVGVVSRFVTRSEKKFLTTMKPQLRASDLHYQQPLHFLADHPTTVENQLSVSDE